MAFNCVRNAYGKLADNQSTEPIAKRLKEYLTVKGLRVLLAESEHRNQYFLRSSSPAALLRLLEDFLLNLINEAKLRAQPPPFLPMGYRMHKRKSSKSTGTTVGDGISVLTAHLEELETWKNTHFGEILKNYPALEQKFNECRSRQLILTHLTAPVVLPQLSGRRSPVEIL
jgi:hypothetical protein